MTNKILFVDDESNVLQSLRRQLRKQYEVVTAESGEEALELIDEKGPFAVVVSDMRMPLMDGVELLQEFEKRSPDTVRLMLTGNADQVTAVAAVNDGRIFRFLNKPCGGKQLTTALDASLEQYRLVTAERELLSNTLVGSVSLLSEVLSVSRPSTFSSASLVRSLAKQFCKLLDVPNAWEIELAASLSQIGTISIHDSTLDRIAQGRTLSDTEQYEYENYPIVSANLIAKIPRLSNVSRIVRYHRKGFDGKGMPDDRVMGEGIPIGARILKICFDFYEGCSRGLSEKDSLSALRASSCSYDPALIFELQKLLGLDYVVRAYSISQLTNGMLLEEHICDSTGGILLGKGKRITPDVLQRLSDFGGAQEIVEPIYVRTPMNEAQVNGAPSEKASV